jgi:hypothetical protein
MTTRHEFLTQLWRDTINSPMQEHWIENVLSRAKQLPNGAFADLGPALQRLLQLGASRRDLSLLCRFMSYEAVFNTLYMLGDPGVEGKDIEMLHESLLRPRDEITIASQCFSLGRIV